MNENILSGLNNSPTWKGNYPSLSSNLQTLATGEERKKKFILQSRDSNCNKVPGLSGNHRHFSAYWSVVNSLLVWSACQESVQGKAIQCPVLWCINCLL